MKKKMYAIIYATKRQVLNGKYMTISPITGGPRLHDVDVYFSDNKNTIPCDAEQVIKTYKTKRNLLKALKKWEIDINDIDEDELNKLL